MKLFEFLEVKDPILCPIVQFCEKKDSVYVLVLDLDGSKENEFDLYEKYIMQHRDWNVVDIMLCKARNGLEGLAILLKE